MRSNLSLKRLSCIKIVLVVPNLWSVNARKTLLFHIKIRLSVTMSTMVTPQGVVTRTIPDWVRFKQRAVINKSSMTHTIASALTCETQRRGRLRGLSWDQKLIIFSAWRVKAQSQCRTLFLQSAPLSTSKWWIIKQEMSTLFHLSITPVLRPTHRWWMQRWASITMLEMKL